MPRLRAYSYQAKAAVKAKKIKEQECIPEGRVPLARYHTWVFLWQRPPWQRPPGQRPPGQRSPCGQTNTRENITFGNFTCGREQTANIRENVRFSSVWTQLNAVGKVWNLQHFKTCLLDIFSWIYKGICIWLLLFGASSI